MLPSSLNRLVDWSRALPLFNVPVQARVLPYFTACPACGGRMGIYDDRNVGGAWWSCSCASGDLIELAARTWQLSEAGAIRKLLTLGAMETKGEVLEYDIGEYLKAHVHRRRSLQEYWDGCQKHLLQDDSRTRRTLQQKLGLRLGMTSERWLAGPGQFLGGTDRKAVVTAFWPGLAERQKLAVIFRGPGWEDMLLVPFWDMPGRLKGFLCIGRNGEPSQGDHVYHGVRNHRQHRNSPVKAGHGGYKHDDDAGIAMWPAASHRRADLGDAVFVVPDPILALQLHAWHFQDNQDTLPLVATWDDGKTRTAPQGWMSLTGGPLVFWGPPEAIVRTYRDARAAGGRVARLPWPKEAGKALARRPLADLLRELLGSARPWKQALADELRSLGGTAAEDLMRRVLVDQVELSSFVATAPEDLRARLTDATTFRTQRAVRMDNVEVIEDDSGWTLANTLERVSDTVLRIERASYHPLADTTYYGGFLRQQGQVVPFYDRAALIERDTVPWMRRVLLRAGASFPAVSHGWAHKLVSLATKLHKPVVCRGLDTIGWDAEEGAFVFHGFAIRGGGEVTDIPAFYPKDSEDVPALGLSRPAPLSEEEVRALRGTHAARLLWAVAAATLHNLLCPLFDQQPAGFVLAGGAGGNAARRLATALGCIPGRYDLTTGHGWPVAGGDVLTTPQRRAYRAWLKASPARNALVRASWHAGMVLGCGGWNVIETDGGDPSLPPELLRAAAKVLPAALQHAAARHFETGGKSVPEGAEKLLTDWFEAQGGDRRTVWQGCELVHWYAPGKVAGLFLRLVARLHDDGQLVLAKPERLWRKPNQIVDTTGEPGGGLLVLKDSLNACLADADAQTFDGESLSRHLADAGVLLKETEVADRPGWLVESNAWADALSAWRASRGGAK